jgi:hypothetical protein
MRQSRSAPPVLRQQPPKHSNLGAYLVGLILILLVYAPGVYFGGGIPTFHVEDVIILAAGLYAIASLMSKKAGPMPQRVVPFLIAYILLVIWFNTVTIVGLLEGLEEKMLRISLLKAISLWRGVLFALITICLVRSRKDINIILSTLLLIGGIQAVIFVCQKFDIYGINDWLTPKYSLVVDSSEYSLKGFRTDGTFGNPNHAGVAMVPIAAVSMAIFLSPHHSFIRRIIPLAVLLGLSLSSVLLTQSRTSAAGIFAACGTIVLLEYRQFTRVLQVIGLGLGVVSIIIPIILLTEGDFSERFVVFSDVQQFWNDDSLSTRREMWRSGLSSLTGAELLVGKGFSGYIEVGWFDSGYVDFLYTGGILGIVTYAACCFSALKAAFAEMSRLRPSESEMYLQTALIGIVVGILVVTISHPLFYQDKIWLLYLSVIVIALTFRPEASPDANRPYR